MRKEKMNVKHIAKQIEIIAPPRLAQDWDNVGLLVGDSGKNVKNILLTIDVTKEVVAEAKKLKTDLIISYHPIIWSGLKKITSDGPEGVIYNLICSNIAVYSIHTALDAAIGGVNDGLADIVGIKDGKPIGDYVQDLAGDNYKLVVYIPLDAVAKVANAIFAAGAGHIGNYSHCSWQSDGTGTFKPLEGARPAIGAKGRLEKVAETRLESIVPADRLADVIEAMKAAHPYETPAFDVYRLYKEQNKFGLGRIGRLEKPALLKTIIAKIKRATGAKAVGLVGPKNRIVTTAAVCAGYCGKIINSVISEGVDLYLTGELKHHQALAAQQAGVTCICLSHSISERFILAKFAKQLQKVLENVKINISKEDKDPFNWKQP
jgi:dinuclear metal center YbgI/SA1388 family protein